MFWTYSKQCEHKNSQTNRWLSEVLYRAVLKVVQLYWTRRMIQLSICGTAHGWAGMQHMSGRCLISICVLLGDVRVLMGAVRRSRPSRYLPKMGRLKEITEVISEIQIPTPSRSCGKLLLWSRTKNRHPIWLWGGLVRLYYIVGHCTWFQYKGPLPRTATPARARIRATDDTDKLCYQ